MVAVSGLAEFGDAALARPVEMGLAMDVLIGLAVSQAALVEAIAQPVFDSQVTSVELMSDNAVFGIGEAQPEALLDRPAVAGLAPFVEHGAGGADDAAPRLGRFEGEAVKRAVRLDVGGEARRRGARPAKARGREAGRTS